MWVEVPRQSWGVLTTARPQYQQAVITVENLVNNASSRDQPRVCWFKRAKDGSGEELDGDAKVWPRICFPALTLRRKWPQAQQTELVENYLSGLAPRMLTLQDLSDSVREQLVYAACSQALLVDLLCPLYPVVLNPELITAARVEARLRRSATHAVYRSVY